MFVYQMSQGMDMFIADDAPLQVPANLANVRAFHAAPAYGDLRLTVPIEPQPEEEEAMDDLITPTPLPPEIELVGEAYFGVVSNPITLEEDVHEVYIERASDFSRVLTLPALTVEARQNYDLLLLPATEAEGGDLVAVLIARPD